MRGYWPPPIWVPSERPGKKWLGKRGGLWVAAGGAGFFLFLLLVGGLLLHNGAAVITALLVGSVTVAGAFLYTMAYRIGPRDTVSVGRLLVAFGLGGLVAVTIGSTFDSLLSKVTGGVGAHPSTVVLLLAGVSEELAKILAVVLVSRGLGDKSMRNGLFLGGAVGLGFAALEDLSYAVSFYENPPVQLHLTHIGAALVLVPTRALLTPLLHPLYTALLGAALFSSSKNGRFRVTWRVIVAYLGVSLAHGLWDGSAGVLQNTEARFLLPVVILIVYPGIIVGSGLIWIKVARRARWQFQLPVAWWLRLPQGPPLGTPPLGSTKANSAVGASTADGASTVDRATPADGASTPDGATQPDGASTPDGATPADGAAAVESAHPQLGAAEPLPPWGPPAPHTVVIDTPKQGRHLSN